MVAQGTPCVYRAHRAQTFAPVTSSHSPLGRTRRVLGAHSGSLSRATLVVLPPQGRSGL